MANTALAGRKAPPAGGPAVRIPGRIVHAGMGRMRHQLVIGRMKLDLVAAIAPGIERSQFRRVLVGDPAALRHDGRSPMLAEIRQLCAGCRAAIGGHGRDEWRVRREEVDVLKGRRLVEDVVGGERSLRHGLPGDWSLCARCPDNGLWRQQRRNWNRRIISLRAGAGQRKVHVR